MIYLTGDTHGEFVNRLTPLRILDENRWTSNDKLIVLGDFGLIFFPRMEMFMDKISLEREKIAFLESKKYEILFIDGNHECFPRLTTEFPQEERYGGMVRRIGRNIFWLQRGQIYEIEGSTFFCMGGAYSIDKAHRLAYDRSILEHYENCPDIHISWWPQELPAADEYKRATENLLAHNKKVDYVLSHQAPRSLIQLMKHTPDPHDMELTGFLDWIWYEVKFKHWFFGHWHLDEEVHPKATALYYDVVDLPTEDN